MDKDLGTESSWLSSATTYASISHLYHYMLDVLKHGLFASCCLLSAVGNSLFLRLLLIFQSGSVAHLFLSGATLFLGLSNLDRTGTKDHTSSRSTSHDHPGCVVVVRVGEELAGDPHPSPLFGLQCVFLCFVPHISTQYPHSV